MNFIPCKLVEANGGLAAQVNEAISVPIPSDHKERYRPQLGKDLILGLRPEHIRETRSDDGAAGVSCSVTPDVVEPLGMETMVYFGMNGMEICARVAPEASPNPGTPLTLSIDANRAHLIDPSSDMVL